jgi:predicted DNA-binding transcriptional regulator AlpA
LFVPAHPPAKTASAKSRLLTSTAPARAKVKTKAPAPKLPAIKAATQVESKYTPKKHHLDKRLRHLLGINERGGDRADPDDDADELLTTNDVGKWLGVSHQWLVLGRMRGYGPRFVRIGHRSICYRRGAVRQWLIEREHACTSEYAVKDDAKASAANASC